MKKREISVRNIINHSIFKLRHTISDVQEKDQKPYH